jgi:hypothetical protein
MKRAGVVCVLFALVAGALVVPADAANKRKNSKKVTRRAEATYQYPAAGSPTTKAPCVTLTVVGDTCPTFVIYPTEKWVTMDVDDAASPTPVAFSIWQNPDDELGEGALEIRGGPFCGSSGKEPVKLTPGVEVGVLVYASGDVVCPGAFGTTGTVKAVFSNVP